MNRQWIDNEVNAFNEDNKVNEEPDINHANLQLTTPNIVDDEIPTKESSIEFQGPTTN